MGEFGLPYKAVIGAELEVIAHCPTIFQDCGLQR